MARMMPSSVAEFLAGKRFAVAGVSRQLRQAANAVYRKFHGLQPDGAAQYSAAEYATII